MRIMGAQTVQQPSSHTIYNVQCSAGVVRWEVRKRFSDFVQVDSSRVCFHSREFVFGMQPGVESSQCWTQGTGRGLTRGLIMTAPCRVQDQTEGAGSVAAEATLWQALSIDRRAPNSRPRSSQLFSRLTCSFTCAWAPCSGCSLRRSNHKCQVAQASIWRRCCRRWSPQIQISCMNFAVFLRASCRHQCPPSRPRPPPQILLHMALTLQGTQAASLDASAGESMPCCRNPRSPLPR